MARVKASSDQTPIPVFGSGVILVPKMAPNGVFSRYPPANACRPGWVWDVAQCPTAERASPLETNSAEKVDGVGGSIGAIEGRHAKSNKPANMRQAVTSIAIEMRRIIVVFFPSGPEFLGVFIFNYSLLQVSEVLTNSDVSSLSDVGLGRASCASLRFLDHPCGRGLYRAGFLSPCSLGESLWKLLSVIEDAAFVIGVMKFSAVWSDALTDSKKCLSGGQHAHCRCDEID